MKKRNLLAILLSFLFVSDVSAACSYSEQAQLNKDVSNIKVTYEEQTGVVDPDLYGCIIDGEDASACEEVEYNYFSISILNMTEDFYITVSNNVDKTKKTYYYADAKDGIISFDWEGIMNVTTFTFDVFASNETGCHRDDLRTIYLTTPRKNPYHYYGQCQNDPEYYLCQKYVTFAEMDFYEFTEKMEERAESIEENINNNNSQSIPEKIWDFISDNKIIFIGIGGVAVAGVIVTIIVRNKRKKSVL